MVLCYRRRRILVLAGPFPAFHVFGLDLSKMALRDGHFKPEVAKHLLAFHDFFFKVVDLF